MSKKEILLSVLLILMVIANVANIVVNQPRKSVVPEAVQEEFKNELAELVENSDNPVIIDRFQVGDDIEPEIHTIYAVKIPFKRYVGDDQIYIYEVVTE